MYKQLVDIFKTGEPMREQPITNPEESALLPEEWKKQRDEIHDLRNRIMDALKPIYGDDIFTGYFHQYERIIQEIRNRILESGIDSKQASKYLAWHLIAGGGAEQTTCPVVDFPGELSIKCFLEEKLTEIQ